MGRISASDAQDLYNAYASVYKTTEEDFSEIESLCEEWLQERIEEEFDFSQYTIEELAEAIQGGLMDRAKQDGAARRDAQGQAFQSFANRGGILGFLQRRLQGARDRVQQSRGQGNQTLRQPGDPERTSQPTTRIDRSSSTPASNPAATRRTEPAAATPAAKPAPAATPAAKPAPAATPAAKPAPAATPAKPVRSISQDLADLRAMRTASQMRQQGKKINGKIPLGSDVQAASNSVSDLNKGARQYTQTNSADLFDIVKGHLLDEGYAETEEAALAIMSNMSEEWRNEIIESSCGGGHSKKKKKKSGY